MSRYQYPDTVHHGDVLDADYYMFADLGIDLVMGGSPCTFWSIAKANREIDKSGMGWRLFMRFVEAVRQIRPRYFLLENVASMPGNIKAYISEELGCEPVQINSALVSAQSRKRLYWTNIGGITQPEDKGLLLKDILETGLCIRDKSHCIDACYGKGGNYTSPHKQSGKRMMVYEPIALADKSQTILSSIHKENALSMLKRKKTGLFVAHEADDADANIFAPVRIGEIGKGGQGNRIYSVQGKTVSIMANGGGRGAKTGLYKIDLPDGDYTIRKLTPVEAERCQTLPDNYTAWGIDDKGNTVKISNTQRYRAIGNGFTADVIAHILGYMEFHKTGGDK